VGTPLPRVRDLLRPCLQPNANIYEDNNSVIHDVHSTSNKVESKVQGWGGYYCRF